MIAYATFAHHDAALVQAVSAKVLNMPGVFDPQAIANTLWAPAGRSVSSCLELPFGGICSGREI